jgi:hypothetical protein
VENFYHIFEEVNGEFWQSSSPFGVPKQKGLSKNSLQK